MTETLYWYDLETTGIDSILDRPLQFAGVRTDLDLNEIKPPQNFLGRPGTDVLPQPEALLVTGISLVEIQEKGISERAFTEKVLEQFNQPQSCVVGFNSLRFDDEFTRQMLYRNFHDPYAREWRNGNSRWDVIDLFRAAYALRPEGFNWPKKDNGSPSFKLEDMARANGLAHIDAHDALADVRATIEITRRLRAAQPKLYDFMFRLRGKKAVLQQLYPLGKNPIVHISSMYPASRGCTALVMPICQHPGNNNGIICFDLSQAPEALISASAAELARLVFTPNDQLEENEQRIALKTIHINRCPFVAPLATLNDERAGRLGIDRSQSESRAIQLMGVAGLVEKIQEVYGGHHYADSEDPDFQLYQGGFFSDADRNTMSELLAVPPEQLGSFEGRFQDDRLDEMLFRFRGRNHPELFNEAELIQWRAFCAEKWSGGQAIDELELRVNKLEQGLEDAAKTVLAELRAYLDERRNELVDN
ncbi:MAG: exodeoxyribonuclease I [Gammaproteobacteria bacterium]|jgi:exodeoxyribonuclease-1|nr:exodeoxyribonuclease I [Gammaproteobacteria bacterium]MBT7177313.1 exodeoxyribonuclease I [Gammaproteobacteria bacterium]MBT7799331.1 exodeoxyribonuclease I [Gammaproteobacteria bacterium]